MACHLWIVVSETPSMNSIVVANLPKVMDAEICYASVLTNPPESLTEVVGIGLFEVFLKADVRLGRCSGR